MDNISVNSGKTSRYEFRVLSREFLQVTAFGDDDDSGTFDPLNADISSFKYAAKKRSKSHTSGSATHHSRSSTGDHFKKISIRNARQNGLQKWITLKLGTPYRTSPQGSGVSATLRQSNDFKLARNSSVGYNSTKLADLNLTSVLSDRLRKTSKNVISGNPSVQQLVGLDSSGPLWEEVTLGHPEFRGCRACFEMGDMCSLIRAGDYPCDYCKGEEEECQTVPGALVRNGCKTCQLRQIPCSFKTVQSTIAACRQCQEAHFPRCCAQSMRTCSDIRLDCVLAQQGNPVHKYCRDEEYFKHITRVESAELKDNPELSPEQPIIFFDNLDLAAADSCHWCNDFPCAVITNRDPDSIGSQLIVKQRAPRGLQPETYRPMRMCSDCTILRLRIIACADHKLVKINRDLETYNRERADGEKNTNFLHADRLWCYVCTATAIYSCGPAWQKIDTPASFSCNLRLCTECAVELVMNCDNDVSTLVETIASRDNTNVRSDADLLRADGLLVEKVRHREDDIIRM